MKPSYSSLRVSDDNAFVKSLFRTFKYRPKFPSHGFADLDAARQWAMRFVHWYHNEHRHSGIRYVTPAQWSGQTRNWTPTGSVALNPERDAIVNEVEIMVHKQAHVA